MFTHFRRCLSVLLLAISVALTPLLVEANSTPVRLNREPVFEISPLLDTPLIVAKELLTIEVGPSSSEAMVRAAYEIVNPRAEALTVPMIFPAVSEVEPLLRPRITLNGEELAYELFLAGSASVQNYFQSPQEFGDQVDVTSILAAINEPLHEPSSFKPHDQATLYEVTLGGHLDRQSTISFEFDPEKTKVLSFSHQGYQGSRTQSGSQVTFSRYVGANTLGEKMAVLVIGEDNLKGLTVSSGDSLTKMKVTVDGYLKQQLSASDAEFHDFENRNVDNLYSAVLRELDSVWLSDSSGFGATRSFDDVVSNVLSRSNISAFLFTAEIGPDSTNDLIVSYPVRATIDRSSSTDYVNTFAYILSPAGNFADFGTLDIEIHLNAHSPYILESSIPLTTAGSGKYTASLQGLPEVDLVFSTFTKPQITALDSLKASSTYPLLALLIGAGLLLVIALIVVLVRRPFSAAQ